MPVSGSFSTYGSRYVEEEFGFALGSLGWYNWTVTIAVDLVASQLVMNYWVLGEGRLFFAVSLLEGQKPFDRIVGWQGDFRNLDPQTYATYQAKFPQIDNIPLIGNTSADSISPEKVLNREKQVQDYIRFYQDNIKRVPDITQNIPEQDKPKVFIELRVSTADECCRSAGKDNMGDFMALLQTVDGDKLIAPIR